MATEIAAAYVSLIPSARGIQKGIARELSGLNGIARTTGAQMSESVHSQLTSRFRTTMSELGRIAKVGGVVIGAGLVGAGLWGVKQAADFEQTQIAFEGILGTTERAKALISDLRQFAARTPFEFPDLTRSARQLLGVGFAAEDIIPTLGTLGDTAATLGAGPAEIESVVRALGQIKGKGKAASQELIQISEALPGFSAIGAIAEGLGITTAEAFKRVEQGAVPADEAIRLILEGMDEFPGAAGAMDRQSRTLNGVISTFKDTLSTTAIDFITPYLPAMSNGVRTVSDWITVTLVPGLQDFVDFISGEVVPTATDAFDAIGEWWDTNGANITDGLTDFGDVAVSILGAVATFVLTYVVPALAGLTTWIADNKAVLFAFFATLTTAFLILAVAATAAAIAEGAVLLPLLLAAAATAVLAGLLYYAYENWGWFTEGVNSAYFALITITGWIGNVIGFVAALIDIIRDAIVALDDLGDKANPFGGGPVSWAAEKLGIFTVKGERAKGGPVGRGSWLVGENGPEILSLGAGQSGHVTANSDIGAAVSGPTLNVYPLPGEDPIPAAMRALKWHSQTQMALAG